MQVEKLNDEGVKLKTLQTALTLMQSPVLAQSEVGEACHAHLLCRIPPVISHECVAASRTENGPASLDIAALLFESMQMQTHMHQA